MRRDILRLMATLLAAAGAAACSDSAAGPGPLTPIPVARVVVTPGTVSVDTGKTVQLTVTVEDASGSALTGRTVAWSSSAPGLATVDGNGLVTGKGAGSANISATSEGKAGSAAVTVSAPQPAPPLSTPFVLAAMSGKTLLGGRAYYNVLRTALWTSLGDLNVPLTPVAVGVFVLPSGSVSEPGAVAASETGSAPTTGVLFAGGYESQTGISSTRRAVLYLPLTNTSAELQLNVARNYHTMTLLPGGRVLLAGGSDGAIQALASAEIFTESTRQFTVTGAMGAARSRHAAALLPDGRVLITGGLVPLGAGPVTTDVASTEIYNPASGTFTAGPNMTVARFNHSAIALADGRVLVLGGNRLRSAEVYNPGSNSFTAVGTMTEVHGLGHQAVKLASGKVLVLGGDANVIQPTATAELFDPATDTFSAVPNMTAARMLHFAVLTETGAVLVGGGQGTGGDLLATTELYDPVANTFTRVADVPFAASEIAAVLVQR